VPIFESEVIATVNNKHDNSTTNYIEVKPIIPNSQEVFENIELKNLEDFDLNRLSISDLIDKQEDGDKFGLMDNDGNMVELNFLDLSIFLRMNLIICLINRSLT